MALWGTAIGAAALGAWTLFDATPGINWGLWTGLAVLGQSLFARPEGQSAGPRWFLRLAPIVIAGAAARTGSPPISALIVISVVFLMSLLMLSSHGSPERLLTLPNTVMAPLHALGHAVLQTVRSMTGATEAIRSPQARAWVRGIALTVPVVIVLALLLSGADPTFASWRDAIGSLLTNWDFVPRVLFFTGLLVIVLGAYVFAWSAALPHPPPALQAPRRWFGTTERLILLCGVASVLWLFPVLQLGYLFGNVPQSVSSGLTFAEYARRGFAELSIVASISALLIVGSEQYGVRDARGHLVRLVSLAVIAAVLLLLVSAFRRVSLYEAAYGFTTARLYAQVYMCAVALGLFVLTVEVASGFDAARLFRRSVALVTLLFVGLIYWNHEAWIARRNIDRYVTTGKLDVAYLSQLSVDAIPVVLERGAALPEPMRTSLLNAAQHRYAQVQVRPRRWFEWNLSRERAERALARLAPSA